MVKVNKRRFDLDTRQINYLKKALGINKIEEIDVAVMKRLKEKLKQITDTRVKYKTKFKIWDIIMCAIIAVLFNSNNWEEIHDFVEEHYLILRKFLLMTGGVPCAKTYERVFSIINVTELETILVEFAKSLDIETMEKDLLSLDGRQSKGSARKETAYSEKVKALNMLNVYSNKYGLCLASEMIEDKTNEIPTVPEILKRVVVKGNIISWDALNTQKDNVFIVKDLEGDYVAPIKGNHPTFYSELILFLDNKRLECIKAGNSNSEYLDYYEVRGSESIHYEYYQTSDINWYEDKKDWAGLKTIGAVKKTIDNGIEIKEEIRYYISSLQVDIKTFSYAIRNHWSVENKLHWHLDFTFKQDENTTKNKNALANLEIVNKFCLGLLEKIKPYYKNKSLKRIRKTISYDFEQSLVDICCFLFLSKNSNF